MNFDSQVVRTLRDHLLGLSQDSVPPKDPAGRPEHATPEELAIVERFEPFAELLFLVTEVDGVVSRSERATILGAFRALTGGRVSHQRLAKMEADLQERCQLEGRTARLEAACTRLSLNRDDAELAFTLANAVALADARLTENAQELLLEISPLLGVSRTRFNALVESRQQSQPPPSS